MPYLYLDDLRLYYEEEGDGQPLVLIHGASQDTLSWHDNIRHFATRYRVLAIDLPGHGKSALVERRPTTTTEEFTGVVWRFIEAKQLREPIIIGHSLGAGVAIMTSIEHPEAIKGVVAVCGGAAFRGSAGVSYQGDLLRNTQINATDWLETIFHSVLGRTTSLERRREMAFDATRCSPYVSYADLLTYAGLNLYEAMHKVRRPVHWIVGEDDWSTTPAMARATSAQFAAQGVASEVHELKGLGHIPHWEQPDAFNAMLDTVLAKFDASDR
ncbi:alpha/beta hydrolase [Caballeronia sp. LZ035]|uniref:alpha/beta fold hydrolase n=1 Tax=Caballeronia sp. LZ035 TaxID=3038568 RepID=UPI0028541FEB|nr:alpha/beta hydrolase [Caballeronia sp. LZ035]MDR5760718.1 alpha/beta hydrolase [Caballeronia sp. LZ035]